MSDYLPPTGRMGCLLPAAAGVLSFIGFAAIVKLAMSWVLRWK